jgi:hypothetical protein
MKPQRWGKWEHLVWEREQEKAFKEIKKAITNAPALGLLGVMKPFFLYVHEQKRIAIGVLAQLLGSWHHLVASLSKQLDAISQGWPPCLRALAATTALVTEADKLTLGQKLTVWVPHSIMTLTKYKGNYWLTNSWMVKYQSMLCENPHIQLEVVKAVNLATLLPIDLGHPEHDCLEVMDEVFSSWPYLTNQPNCQSGR